MTSNAPRPDPESGRVVPFRRRDATRSASKAPRPDAPVDDLAKYARSNEPDDYRQRMINNGLALTVCVVLVAIGIWLASAIAEMRRNQDCVLSGRRDCSPINVQPANPT